MSYKVIFEDKDTWFGGHYADSKWNEMPSKPIAKIIYTLNNKTITLEGYHAYNHLVERACLINKGQSIITQVLLMAKKNDDVLVVIFDLRKKTVKFKPAIYEQEYNKKPATGWRYGITSKKPRFYLK